MNKNGVEIEIIKEGNGDEVSHGKSVTVHYSGMFVDGEVFDSSKNRGVPLQFPLGAGHVIKGWDIGVEGMKRGEVRKLTIPGNLAYGSSGVPGIIPPDAILVFEVELIDFN